MLPFLWLAVLELAATCTCNSAIAAAYGRSAALRQVGGFVAYMVPHVCAAGFASYTRLLLLRRLRAER
jgi:hypothetical protein